MAFKTDVVVIGAGLFGSMIYRHLTDKGLDVVVIDRQHPMSASKCSFGVWKPGWVNNIIKEQVSDGMELLEKHSKGIRQIEIFNVKKEKIELFSKVDCSNILTTQFLEATVTGIKDKTVYFKDEHGEEEKIVVKKAVIVAAGVWTTEILNLAGAKKSLPGVDKIWGATLELPDDVEENRIMEWAPYRQSVLVRKDVGTFYFGDGATVKNPKDVDDPRVGVASDRLLQHLNDILQVTYDVDRIKSVNEGYRPYLKKGTPGFVAKHNDWLISATGGAKNSTILCGHVAKLVLEALP